MNCLLARLATGLCVVMGLAACSQVVSPSLPSTVSPALTPTSTASNREPPRYAPVVTDPKDARGITDCGLLTPAQLADLGLNSENVHSEIVGAARVCTWPYLDGRNSAGLQISTDRTIAGLDGIYLQRAGFVLFEPVTVADHPGFRGDQVAGDCTLYVAISNYQLMSLDGNLRGNPMPDRCALARRMGELILSNLPPLTE